MQEQNMSYSEHVLHEYKEGLGTFTRRMPELARYYNAFTEECFKEGALSQKQKHLMALAISTVLQDEYCMIYHTKGCLDHRCSEEEIFEATGVAAAFGGGAAMSQAVTRVQDCIDDLRNSKTLQ